MSTPPIAIAHRGDPLNERENTLAAYQAAARAGADMAELDLQRTRDGEIVVLHDPTFLRLWDIEASVGDLDLDAVREIGSGDLRVPTLHEVLATVDLPFMIDFTGPEVVARALQVVREAGAMASSIFVSGHLGALGKVRTMAPDARIGATWTRSEPPAPSLLRELRAEFWNPVFPVVEPEVVGSMHAAGFKVSVWTVDEQADMVRLLDMGSTRSSQTGSRSSGEFSGLRRRTRPKM